jgi:hypothetical protein
MPIKKPFAHNLPLILRANFFGWVLNGVFEFKLVIYTRDVTLLV